MIIKEAEGHTPQIAPTARGAENIVVTGDVAVGEDVTLWYGCVLRGDTAPIRIGRGSNIQDNSVVHCSAGRPVVVGENVVVGHAAVLHGCTVEDGSLIGMGATVLDGTVIGAGSIVGAGALVPSGKVIPPGSLAMGVPARVVRSLTAEEQADTLKNAAHYVEAGRRLLSPISPPSPEKV